MDPIYAPSLPVVPFVKPPRKSWADSDDKGTRIVLRSVHTGDGNDASVDDFSAYTGGDYDYDDESFDEEEEYVDEDVYSERSGYSNFTFDNETPRMLTTAELTALMRKPRQRRGEDDSDDDDDDDDGGGGGGRRQRATHAYDEEFLNYQDLLSKYNPLLAFLRWRTRERNRRMNVVIREYERMIEEHDRHMKDEMDEKILADEK
jgi:hypothetical protein